MFLKKLHLHSVPRGTRTAPVLQRTPTFAPASSGLRRSADLNPDMSQGELLSSPLPGASALSGSCTCPHVRKPCSLRVGKPRRRPRPFPVSCPQPSSLLSLCPPSTLLLTQPQSCFLSLSLMLDVTPPPPPPALPARRGLHWFPPAAQTRPLPWSPSAHRWALQSTLREATTYPLLWEQIDSASRLPVSRPGKAKALSSGLEALQHVDPPPLGRA